MSGYSSSDYYGRHRELEASKKVAENALPVNTTTIIFILFILITSSMELYMGSPNGFSIPKVVFSVIFIGLIEYIVRSNSGPAGQSSGLAWALVIVYFITYFTITIVSTSCAKYNMRQLVDLRDYGLVSPFVLSKKQLKKLRSHKSKEDRTDDDDDFNDDFDEDDFGDGF